MRAWFLFDKARKSRTRLWVSMHEMVSVANVYVCRFVRTSPATQGICKLPDTDTEKHKARRIDIKYV